MEAMIEWTLRSSIYLMVFGVVFLLFFKRKTNVVFNRLYILTTTVFSMILPFLPVSFDYNISNQGVGILSDYVIQLPEVIVGNIFYSLPEVTVTGERALSASDQSILQPTFLPWMKYILITIYSVIAFFFVFRLGKLLLTIVTRKRESYRNMYLVKSNDDILPFSFFCWLFINEQQRKDPRFESVYAHENAHYQKLHSLDNLLFELLAFMFWFHPVWYIFRKEIKSLHEFEADAVALKTTIPLLIRKPFWKWFYREVRFL